MALPISAAHASCRVLALLRRAMDASRGSPRRFNVLNITLTCATTMRTTMLHRISRCPRPCFGDGRTSAALLRVACLARDTLFPAPFWRLLPMR